MTNGESGTGNPEWKMADDCPLHASFLILNSRFPVFISLTTARVLVAKGVKRADRPDPRPGHGAHPNPSDHRRDPSGGCSNMTFDPARAYLD
jgi:hypothetical protein